MPFMKKTTLIAGFFALCLNSMPGVIHAEQSTPAANKVTSSTTEVTTGMAAVLYTPHATPARVTPTPFSEQELAAHLLPKNAPKDLSNIVSLVYSGARRSMLDPCGCVGKQLGGLDKEARLPAWLKEQGVPPIQLDAGGFLKNAANPIYVQQARLLLRALGQLKVDAINIGVDDLAAGLKMLQEEKTSSSLPLVSANIVADGKPLFDPYKIVEVKTKGGAAVRVGIIGVTRAAPKTAPRKTPATAITTDTESSGDDTTSSVSWLLPEVAKGWGSEATPEPAKGTEAYEIIDQAEAIRKVLPEVREKSDIVILLDYEARDFVRRTLSRLEEEAEKIDVAIAGEYLAPKGDIEIVGTTRLVSPGFEGRYVGHMLLEMKDSEITSATNVLIEVLQSFPSVPELTRTMETARDNVKEFTAKQRQASGTTTGPRTASRISFAGQQACQQCHAKQHQQWKTTAHAKAMASLIQKQSQNDPACVRCHVTGYKIDNGFEDLGSTGKFADVQCEVCHGPAFQHVVEKRRAQIMQRMAKASPTPVTMNTPEVKLRKKFDARFCMECHDANNDPKFDFERDIKLVDHSQMGAKRPANAPDTQQTTGPAARMKK